MMKTASLIAITIIAGSLNLVATSAESLQVLDYNGVSYVSGGVGLDERDELNAIAGQFNLKLTFAVKTGNYVSDIAVRVQDRQGRTVLEAVADGPLFYARLAPGTYKVQVAGQGENFQQTAQINSSKQTRLGFYWP